MATALDLVSKALRRIKALAQGQTADGNDAEDALETLNDMIDSMSVEDLLLYYSKIETLSLTVGVSTFTIGRVAADFDIDRPIEILGANIRLADNTDLPPLNIVSLDTFQAIAQKEIGNTYPQYMYYQPTHPNGTIGLWQLPSAGLTLRIQVNALLEELEDLATEIILPPGYKRYFVAELAVQLAPEYGKSAMLPELKEEAKEAKMIIKRKNTKKNVMTIDPSFMPKATGIYNPYSDT